MTTTHKFLPQLSYATKSLSDLPVLPLVICDQKQFDLPAAKATGYGSLGMFVRGALTLSDDDDPTATVVSWSGRLNLTFANTVGHLFKTNYSQLRVHVLHRRLTARDVFLLPYGHCIEVRIEDGPLQPLDMVYVAAPLNSSLVVLLTDPTTSLAYKLAESSFSGDRLVFGTEPTDEYGYALTLTERQALPRNGQCAHYGGAGQHEQHASYAACVEAEQRRASLALFNCLIPWMSATNQCHGVVQNVSQAAFNEFHDRHQFWYYFKSTFDPRYPVACPLPCVRYTLASKFILNFNGGWGRPAMKLNFEPRVQGRELL